MCWSVKCCFFLPANIGCVLLGICSFLLSTCMLATSAAYFIIETSENVEDLSAQRHLSKLLGIKLNVSSVHVILTIGIIVAALWMLFSAMLVIGIAQDKSCLVLCYFSFGIIVTILCQLSALLVLLKNCWILSIILFIISCLHVHFLVVVHTVYELMQRGKRFGFQQHTNEDQDPLADCFDENIDSL